MRLLITRAAKDAARLAERIEALGHEVIMEPLLSIEPLAFELPSGPIAAFLLTSQHAAGLLASSPEIQNYTQAPVCCVGAATAAAARSAGFTHVIEAGGDATALAARVGETIDREAGMLVHVRGRHTTGGIAGPLRGQGFQIAEVIAYEARAAATLSPQVRDALAGGKVDGLLLLSPRTALIFANLVTEAGLRQAVAGRTAYCLSQAVASPLHPLGMRIIIAPQPNIDDLLELLG